MSDLLSLRNGDGDSKIIDLEGARTWPLHSIGRPRRLEGIGAIWSLKLHCTSQNEWVFEGGIAFSRNNYFELISPERALGYLQAARVEPPGDLIEDLAGKTGEAEESLPELVSLDQAIAMVGRTKRSAERYVQKCQDFPSPVVEGGGGKPHYYDWKEVRVWLGKNFRLSKRLPERFPRRRGGGSLTAI
jgi:hypothetical protein